MAGAAAAAVGGGLLQGIFGYESAKQQSEAAAQAQDDQQHFIAVQQAAAQRNAEQAAYGYQGLTDAFGIDQENARYWSQDALGSAADQARAYFTGASQGTTDLYNNALGASSGAINQGLGSAAGTLEQSLALRGYSQGAASPISAYGTAGKGGENTQGLMGRGFALGDALSRPLDLQSDPGYQFRLQQGEQAINRQAAAQGGRGGGATMKALADYNQGMASQEYDAADQRRRSDVQQMSGLLGQEAGLAGTADQMRQSSLLSQAGRSDAAALAAQQNQYGLAGLGYGAAGSLAGMYSDSGRSLADIYQGAARDQSSIQASLAGQQADAALNTGSQLSNIYQTNAVQAAQNALNVQTGYANTLMGAGSQMVGLAGTADFGGGVPYAGAGLAAAGNAAGSTAQNLAYLYAMQNNSGNK